MEELAIGAREARIMELDALMRVVNGWRLKDDKIVLTNGCFDILHRGHVQYLQEAAALGDRLVVGLNTDASVMRQGKGIGRPFNNEHDRAAILSALRCVDAVIFFNEDTPIELIKSIAPDVLVKGGDWSEDRIVGAKEVKANGGQVRSIPLVEGLSTTALVEKIRRSG